MRLNWIFEEQGEGYLVPEGVGAVRQLRTSDMRQSLLVRCEGLVGLERYLGGDNARVLEPGLPFVNFRQTGNPYCRGIGKQRSQFHQVEIATLLLREIHVANALESDSNHQV